MTTKLSDDVVAAINKYKAAAEYLRWESQQRQLDDEDIRQLAFEYAVYIPCLNRAEMTALAGMLFDDPSTMADRIDTIVFMRSER